MLAFGSDGGWSEIAENADADMRDREMLAFENACGTQWEMVVECGELWMMVGNWGVPVKEPKRRQRLRARWVPSSQKILDFYMKFT